MKQITHMEADKLSAKLAVRALGFASVDTIAARLKVSREHAAQILDGAREVAERAAWLGLEAAGALNDSKRRDMQLIERHADEATRKHNAWKKATGAAF